MKYPDLGGGLGSLRPMKSSRGQLHGLDTNGLDTALSEAVCLGLDVDLDAKRLRLDLEVLTLTDLVLADGSAETDATSRRVGLTLHGVSRVAASLRRQRWDDLEPTVLPLELSGLPKAVNSFGGGRLHGWEFIDLDDSSWTLWRDLLSFDTSLDQQTAPHVLEFSQEEGLDPRALDIRVWFDSLAVHDAGDSEDSEDNEIALPDFVAGGLRWWSAHDAGDPRAAHPGVTPPL